MDKYLAQIVKNESWKALDALIRVFERQCDRLSRCVISYENGFLLFEMLGQNMSVRAVVQSGGGSRWSAEIDPYDAAYLFASGAQYLSFHEDALIAHAESGETWRFQAKPAKFPSSAKSYKFQYGVDVLSRLGNAVLALGYGNVYLALADSGKLCAFVGNKVGDVIAINHEDFQSAFKAWKIDAKACPALVEFEQLPTGVAIVEDCGDEISLGNAMFSVKMSAKPVAKAIKPGAKPCKFGKLRVSRLVSFLTLLCKERDCTVCFSNKDGLVLEPVSCQGPSVQLSDEFTGEPFASGAFSAMRLLYTLKAIRSAQVTVGLCEDGLAICGVDAWALIVDR